MYPITPEHKMEIQVDHKSDNFYALLKNILMGCPDSVLPELLLRHTQVNFLLSNKTKEPYKDLFCLFRALAICKLMDPMISTFTLLDLLQNS